MKSARAIHHVAPERVELREISLPPIGPTDVLLKTHYSAISPGTESLIFRGLVPTHITRDETIPSLQGDFSYPFRYGYSLVAEVIEVGGELSEDWIGRRVFTFYPHQDYAVVDHHDCQLIPGDLPLKRAAFLANMESALNLVLDSRPRIGERAIVFGQGVLGLLTLALLSQFPLGQVIAADPIAYRRALSQTWGAALTIDPFDCVQTLELKRGLFRNGDGLDFAIEVSGRMEALNQAVELVGFAGRIVIGSWYGRSNAALDLGGGFHRRRITLISSQVSTISPELSGRWSKNRRLGLAWRCLERIPAEGLITHRYPPSACQDAFQRVSAKEGNVVQAIFDYS